MLDTASHIPIERYERLRNTFDDMKRDGCFPFIKRVAYSVQFVAVHCSQFVTLAELSELKEVGDCFEFQEWEFRVRIVE